MKRISCIILALLMLLLAACTPGQEETAEPTANATAAATAEPGEPSARPTLDPARQAFDPYTDYDNRYAALTERGIVDTEDAYYFYANGYIMYYDKIAGESGFLCPRPECEHDEVFNNKECGAYAAMDMPSFTYYEGKLWWVGYPDNWSIGVFRMDLDGTNRELLRSFELSGDEARFNGLVLWFFHRGRLFWSMMREQIINGTAFDKLEFGYMALDDFEPHVLCERRSFLTSQPTMRFAGDSVYMFVDHDDVDPETAAVPDPELDEEGFIEWRKTVNMIDEVLRWDPSMDEPETVYLNTEEHCFGSFNDYYVSQEGGIYFRESVLEDPEKPYDEKENTYIQYICRVDENGGKERVLELTDGDGAHYYAYNMTCGVIIAINGGYNKTIHSFVIERIWLLTFEGETLYRGELPMEYRGKYEDHVREDGNGKTIIAKHGLSNPHACWATRNELLFCFEERYLKDSETHGDSSYYDFVKYEITPDGLVEIHMAECRMHYSDEGW